MLKRFVLLLFFTLQLSAQEKAIIMTYNVLNYPGSTSTIRNPEFKKIIDEVQPDILVVQEILSQSGVDEFLSDVLTSSNYSAGTFINGSDTDNAIFYNDSLFTFLSNIPISTDLRDINEFKLVHNIVEDTLYIYSVHLKASQGSSNVTKRLAEVNQLRMFSDKLPVNSYFIVLGDFNIYSSSEPGYQRLLDHSSSGFVVDPINSPGSWHNNAAFSSIHTQSTRLRQFGGGATGGLDDRFDMILISQSIMNDGGITYVPNSYTTFGNDGNHFNDSINVLPNTSVSKSIADALHNSSDHLPVYATFEFEYPLPVELTSLNVRMENANAVLYWQTATEINNYGFEIQRRLPENIFEWEILNFVHGAGNSNKPMSYEYIDNTIQSSTDYIYRLKQIDNDGSFIYSYEVELKSNKNKSFALQQNYPNPFNPSTTINYTIPEISNVTINIFDILGNKIKTLVDEQKSVGSYKVIWNAKNLSSGIYFYQIQANEFIDTKKMLLLE
jgi:endonuclease/exonuclease/phosphatase family metal-dependent hydrolase